MHCDAAACIALIRGSSAKSRRDRVGRLSHPTGQAVIVALRRAQWPRLGAVSANVGQTANFAHRSRADSPIAQIRANDRDRAGPGGGREPRRRQPPYRKSSGGQVAAHHSQRDRTEVPNRPSQRPGSVLAEGRRRCCSRSVDPRSTACGTSLEPTASSGSWIATSLLSVRLIVSSMLWVACGAETAVITARSPGALAGRTPAELGRLTGWRA